MMATKAPASERDHGNETRCECGQLIAKVVEGGLELKCKRCKRIVVIPFSSIQGWGNVAS
jgi:hypothetical protein